MRGGGGGSLHSHHIIQSCPRSSTEVQVISLQSQNLFCNAFKINQTRMCEMERPIYYSYLHNTRKKIPLSFSSTISFSYPALERNGNSVCWSVLTCDLVICAALEEEEGDQIMCPPHTSTLPHPPHHCLHLNTAHHRNTLFIQSTC